MAITRILTGVGASVVAVGAMAWAVGAAPTRAPLAYAQTHFACSEMLPVLFWPGGDPTGADQSWKLEPGHSGIVRLVSVQRYDGEQEARVCVAANQPVAVTVECAGEQPYRTVLAARGGAATNVAGVLWRALPPNDYSAMQVCVAYVAPL